MSGVRTFDDGKVIVRFASEEAARDFDEYLDSEFKIVMNGEMLGSTKVREGFNPYEFFHIKREEEE